MLCVRFYSVFRGLGDLRHLHSFPTRRSSDLSRGARTICKQHGGGIVTMARISGAWRRLMRRDNRERGFVEAGVATAGAVLVVGDRKSTRLNSSHVAISYAVFCLKKKKRSNKAS